MFVQGLGLLEEPPHGNPEFGDDPHDHFLYTCPPAEGPGGHSTPGLGDVGSSASPTIGWTTGTVILVALGAGVIGYLAGRR